MDSNEIRDRLLFLLSKCGIGMEVPSMVITRALKRLVAASGDGPRHIDLEGAIAEASMTAQWVEARLAGRICYTSDDDIIDPEFCIACGTVAGLKWDTVDFLCDECDRMRERCTVREDEWVEAETEEEMSWADDRQGPFVRPGTICGKCHGQDLPLAPGPGWSYLCRRCNNWGAW